MNRTEKKISIKNKSKSIERKVFNIILIVVIGIIVFCALVVGIPVIINELYKKNTGYMTLWGAKEVLSYYAVILGCLLNAVISIYIFRKTIQNTKNQILYEKEVDSKKKKWEKIEQIIDNTLKLLEPYQYILVNIDVSDPVQAMNEHNNLTAVIGKMKTTVDWIKAYVTFEEYALIEPLVDLIIRLIDKEMGLCNEFCILCLQVINMQALPDDKDVSAEMQLNKQKEILEKAMQIRGVFSELQSTEYQTLLNQRREVFLHIHKEISKEKEFILNV